MEIFILYKEDYPWDVRVEKLAKSLNETNNTVTIIARNLDQKPTNESTPEFQIRRVPRTQRLPGTLQKMANMPLWFNPLWIFTILKAIQGVSKPVIIVRDLPLVRAATFIARFRSAKVVFDMAEVYPEMYRSSAQFSKRSWLDNIVKNPSIAERYEKTVLPKVDHIIVMIEESRDRLVALGVPEEKVTIVSNTPPIDKYSGHRHKHTDEVLRIVYVGFLTELRGLDLLVEAVGRYIEKGNPKNTIQVDIVGKGASKEKLINLVRRLNIEESVRIHGWLSQEEVDQLMANANIGALTYRVCGHWNHTIPNKIFDYMLAGLPVLATKVLPIERVIEEAHCGVICRDLDPADIAEKLEYLKSPDVRQELGENGYRAVLEKYNWDNDRDRLNEVIDILN
ncbi:glycosyltransferase family 4 protein [Marinobacter orientalis]|uniref:Glycosyltransferase family 4 protein n=1 Tax=Marinobacter orientalis TaxID=1928859 RepID=A0A7Y0RCP9_9GAMM|nr:glycosyltransferase family 4 protein [Marinobacter orientalis]NMT63800.1 glycosyltransferase family 4 protein [Marinobacter orientalis]TGX49909.1 glycosyltransferase WbuB [Marinobacter orientalis]